jgi:hypothetical protein
VPQQSGPSCYTPQNMCSFTGTPATSLASDLDCVVLSHRKVFIKGLPLDVTLNQIRDQILRIVSTDDDSDDELIEELDIPMHKGGGPRGYATITLGTDAMAQAVINGFNGSTWRGQKMTARLDRDQLAVSEHDLRKKAVSNSKASKIQSSRTKRSPSPRKRSSRTKSDSKPVLEEPLIVDSSFYISHVSEQMKRVSIGSSDASRKKNEKGKNVSEGRDFRRVLKKEELARVSRRKTRSVELQYDYSDEIDFDNAEEAFHRTKFRVPDDEEYMCEVQASPVEDDELQQELSSLQHSFDDNEDDNGDDDEEYENEEEAITRLAIAESRKLRRDGESSSSSSRHKRDKGKGKSKGRR